MIDWITNILLSMSLDRFWFADENECGGSLEVTDVAQSLRYPLSDNNYGNNQVCSWILTSSGLFSSRIRITFVRFATEPILDTLTVSHYAIIFKLIFCFENDLSMLPYKFHQ